MKSSNPVYARACKISAGRIAWMIILFYFFFRFQFAKTTVLSYPIIMIDQKQFLTRKSSAVCEYLPLFTENYVSYARVVLYINDGAAIFFFPTRF